MIKMGHNVDFGTLGLCNLKCQRCNEELDISEIDILHAQMFELTESYKKIKTGV